MLNDLKIWQKIRKTGHYSVTSLPSKKYKAEFACHLLYSITDSENTGRAIFAFFSRTEVLAPLALSPPTPQLCQMTWESSQPVFLTAVWPLSHTDRLNVARVVILKRAAYSPGGLVKTQIAGSQPQSWTSCVLNG